MRRRGMRTEQSGWPADDVGDHASTVDVCLDGVDRVVRICGELDVATRQLVWDACVADRDKAVVVEMAELTFMDCCGYGSLVAARLVLQQHGGSLTLRNQVGQPAELLAMLSLLEAGANR